MKKKVSEVSLSLKGYSKLHYNNFSQRRTQQAKSKRKYQVQSSEYCILKYLPSCLNHERYYTKPLYTHIINTSYSVTMCMQLLSKRYKQASSYTDILYSLLVVGSIPSFHPLILTTFLATSIFQNVLVEDFLFSLIFFKVH